MDPKTEELLKDILTKDPEELKPTEVDFLRARSSYLNSEQKRKYAVLLPVQEVVEQQPEETLSTDTQTVQEQTSTDVVTPPVPPEQPQTQQENPEGTPEQPVTTQPPVETFENKDPDFKG